MSQPDLLERATESLFDETTHARLDDEVNKQEFRDTARLGTLDSRSGGGVLLSIIEKSDGKLPTPSISTTITWLQDENLLKLLNECWQSGKYQQIRDLKILRPQVETKSISDWMPIDPVESSFKCQYRGTAADSFYDYLIYHDKAYHHPSGRYYAKFCSIVQSSGTGKSRLMFEMTKKGVLVLYFNLRARDDCGYPERDEIPAQILTEDLPSTEQEYGRTCCTFFAAVFDALNDDFTKHFETSQADTTTLIDSWNDRMCDLGSKARKNFFDNVKRRYEILNPQQKKKKASQVADSTKNWSIHDEQYNTGRGHTMPAQRRPFIWDGGSDSYMTTALRAMATKHPQLLGVQSYTHCPKLLIAIDEAHTLNRPGHYRASDVVCRAISLCSAREPLPIWFAFASTTARVADFSVPPSRQNSARYAEGGNLLFPPFTELGWDQFAQDLQGVNPEHVANADHIVGFGRPLWASLCNAGSPIQDIENLANRKLCGTIGLRENDQDQLLAFLGQRFGLEIAFGHPDSVPYLETAVARHLRVCTDVAPDRVWRFTSYPSEPLLSCVATRFLHSGQMARCLRILLYKVEDGIINQGKPGELASRLLWLLAKDLLVDELWPDMRSGSIFLREVGEQTKLVDCQMIPVLEFLGFVFGEQEWGPGVETAFEDAHVNFTHWVSMETNISTGGDELSAEEWTRRHWYRTSAVQCCRHQPLVDKMIPIFFKGRWPQDCMSQIFISDKVRTQTDSKDLDAITRKDDSIQCQSSLPYIAILCDLGVKTPGFESKFDKEDNSLRIHAKSVDHDTFHFLKNYMSARMTISELVAPQNVPRWCFVQDLKERMRFGRARTKTSMCWEGQHCEAPSSHTG